MNSDEEFDADRVRSVALDVVKEKLANVRYNEDTNRKIVEEIITEVISKLTGGKVSHFKYLTHSMIARRDINGFDAYSNNLWDASCDGMAVVDYEGIDLRFTLVIWGLKYNKH